MIERYSRKVMRDVWTEQNKFSAYLQVEILSCEAWSELGVIPREDVDKIRAAATFDVDRIKEIEEITRHDVVAFTRAVSESLGPERKWVHYGLTSTDVVDTKYEFGKRDGKIILMDEIHTPDSSRYFYADGYAERLARGEHQKQLSKEFVREWLMANGFQGQAGQQVPEMTPEVVAGITERYIELYEHITGVPFVKAEDPDPAARIEKNITDFLKSL